MLALALSQWTNAAAMAVVSPGSAYAPFAIQVHEESAVAVLGATLGANGGVDTPHGLLMCWLRLSPLRIGDIVANPQSVSATSSETVPGLDLTSDNATGQYGSLRMNTNDATGGANHGATSIQVGALQPFTGGWVHLAWGWDNGFAGGSKRACLYINGIKQTNAGQAENGTVGSFNVAVNAAGGWGINVTGAANPPMQFDIAQVFLDIHTAGLVDGSNSLTIPTTNFITAGGLPVDFGPTGANVTGTQADVLLDGTKATFTTNKGSATGAFAVVWPNDCSGSHPQTSPATTPKIYNSSVGPAGPQDARPYLKWHVYGNQTGMGASTSDFSGAPVTNDKNQIKLGDLLILTENLQDTSGSHDRTAGMSTPSGWTLLPTSGAALPLYNTTSGWPANFAVFYKIAGAGDVTAPWADWATPPALQWTADGTTLRSASWQLMNFGQATTIQAAAAQINGTSTAPTAPSVTPTSAATLLLTLFAIVDSSDAGITYPDTGQELRFKSATTGGAYGYVLVADEKLTGTSATGTRTAAQQLSSATLAVSIVIGP
jgi:hypothetical protein